MEQLRGALKDIKSLLRFIEIAGKKDKAFVDDEISLIEQSISVLEYIIRVCKLRITDTHNGYPNNYYLYINGDTSNCQELTEKEYNMLKGIIPYEYE